MTLLTSYYDACDFLIRRSWHLASLDSASLVTSLSHPRDSLLVSSIQPRDQIPSRAHSWPLYRGVTVVNVNRFGPRARSRPKSGLLWFFIILWCIVFILSLCARNHWREQYFRNYEILNACVGLVEIVFSPMVSCTFLEFHDDMELDWKCNNVHKTIGEITIFEFSRN